jgi:hypothetical protein
MSGLVNPTARGVRGSPPGLTQSDDLARKDTGRRSRVELWGFEPQTSSMPWRRATNCAIAPHVNQVSLRRPASVSDLTTRPVIANRLNRHSRHGRR